MGGSPVIQAPQPDPEQSAYYKYLIEKTKREDKWAEDQRITEENRRAALKTTGTTQLSPYVENLKGQLKEGLISSSKAQESLRDFQTQYGLEPGVVDPYLNTFATESIAGAPEKRRKLAGKLYQDILGRQATDQEITAFEDLAKTGEYGLSNLAESLKGSTEKQKIEGKSAYQNYLRSQYGAPVAATPSAPGATAATNDRTERYKFKVSKALAPVLTSDQQTKLGLTMGAIPDEFTGTAAELEQFRSDLDRSKLFAYNAGLTSLQGSIDENITKLKGQQAKELARVGSGGKILENVVSVFNFS